MAVKSMNGKAFVSSMNDSITVNCRTCHRRRAHFKKNAKLVCFYCGTNKLIKDKRSVSKTFKIKTHHKKEYCFSCGSSSKAYARGKQVCNECYNRYKDGGLKIK